ncbi:MAG: hypothetical protein PHI97_09815 [Desulfobulbus sp.]|nr:hypothetical protein [Desulfobulbus sp.]
MFRITTLNKPCTHVSAEEYCGRMSPLLTEGIDLLCCQSIAHTSRLRNNQQYEETERLAKQLHLTCSCFAADRQTKRKSGSLPLHGQAIFTGPGVWVLNSGSFVIGEGNCEEVVLFALVRKNGSSVLVFNFHLADSSDQQERQLTELFQHNLLKGAHGAVAICTDRNSLLSPKKWLKISAISCYTPFQFESGENGLLSLFNAPNSSIVNLPLEPAQLRQPGLSLAIEIKRTIKSRHSRHSFPLSFREQWLGYRDNRVFA